METCDHVDLARSRFHHPPPPGAPGAGRLSEIGFVEGPGNVHPGQGTANRRFFTDGFTIELLYVSDVEEAATGAGRGLGILARSRDAAASPFGLVVRVAECAAVSDFPNWKYFPDYFSDDLCFHVGNNSSDLSEPLCICMPPRLPKASAAATEHANPGWRLTQLEVRVPGNAPSEVLSRFTAMDGVRVVCGRPHRMTMQFNDAVAGKAEDLAPDLPLVLHW